MQESVQNQNENLKRVTQAAKVQILWGLQYVAESSYRIKDSCSNSPFPRLTSTSDHGPKVLEKFMFNKKEWGLQACQVS